MVLNMTVTSCTKYSTVALCHMLNIDYWLSWQTVIGQYTAYWNFKTSINSGRTVEFGYQFYPVL